MNHVKQCTYFGKVFNDQADTSDDIISLTRHLNDPLSGVWTALDKHFDMCSTVLQVITPPITIVLITKPCSQIPQQQTCIKHVINMHQPV